LKRTAVYSKQKWRKKIFGGVKIVGSCSEIGTILTFYSNKTRKNAIVEYLDLKTRKNAIVEYLD